MEYARGDWVELTEDFWLTKAGQRGEVVRTYSRELDIRLSNGALLNRVDAASVRRVEPSVAELNAFSAANNNRWAVVILVVLTIGAVVIVLLSAR